MGRAYGNPAVEWGTIALRYPAVNRAFQELGCTELGRQLYPYEQPGLLCRIHTRPVQAHDGMPAIYVTWDSVFERLLLSVYGGGEEGDYLTEVCSPACLVELLGELRRRLLTYEARQFPTFAPWPETEAACLDAPGEWVLERLPARARCRTMAACFALEAPDVLDHFPCCCATAARRIVAQRGDAWLYPDPAQIKALAQAVANRCSRGCPIGGFLEMYLDYVQGRTHLIPFLNDLRDRITSWLESDGLADRLGVDAWRELRRERQRRQARFLRDLVGNPFRPIQLPSQLATWRDGTIPRLARGIYEQEAFGDMPILADALEEAGDVPPEVLAHCREPGPHFRGCWALDLLAPDISARTVKLTRYADAIGVHL